MLLSAVEHSSAQISSKRTVRLHNTAHDFLARRFLTNAAAGGSGSAIGTDSGHTGVPLSLRGEGSDDAEGQAFRTLAALAPPVDTGRQPRDGSAGGGGKVRGARPLL